MGKSLAAAGARPHTLWPRATIAQVRALSQRRYIRPLRRLLLIVPQLVAVSLVTFIMVRLIPGDPAAKMLGPLAQPQAVAQLRHQMGFDQPLPTQYGIYLQHLAHGDLGNSWYTGQPVAQDLAARTPATLELITYALAFALIFGVLLGFLNTFVQFSGWRIVTRIYGMIAGSLPDFWVGLILIYVFFFRLRLIPAPIGRLPVDVSPPSHITGAYTLDSLLTGNWDALRASIGQLLLPIATLTFINTPVIVKMTSSRLQEVMKSGLFQQARANGLSDRKIMFYALRVVLPSVATITAVIYQYLLGGAILVESVFSWGGLGQYAAQAVINEDYTALQGFVLIAAIFSLLVYLVLDLLYAYLDPRVEL